MNKNIEFWKKTAEELNKSPSGGDIIDVRNAIQPTPLKVKDGKVYVCPKAFKKYVESFV